MAVHDIMDYGDCEETIYRELFNNGYIRVEVVINNDTNGISSSCKVYYISDPEPVSPKHPSFSFTDSLVKSYPVELQTLASERIQYLLSLDSITIKFSAWQKYNNTIGNVVSY